MDEFPYKSPVYNLVPVLLVTGIILTTLYALSHMDKDSPIGAALWFMFHLFTE